MLKSVNQIIKGRYQKCLLKKFPEMNIDTVKKYLNMSDRLLIIDLTIADIGKDKRIKCDRKEECLIKLKQYKANLLKKRKFDVKVSAFKSIHYSSKIADMLLNYRGIVHVNDIVSIFNTIYSSYNNESEAYSFIMKMYDIGMIKDMNFYGFEKYDPIIEFSDDCRSILLEVF